MPSNLTIASAWPLLLLSAVPLVWWLAWRSRASVSRARVMAAAVLRSVAIVALVGALMRPADHRIGEAVSVIYALDVSSSVSPRFVDEALNWAAQLNLRYRPAQARFVVFGDAAKLVDSVADVRALAIAANASSAASTNAIDQSATDLEQALMTALPAFAPGHSKRIVLLSDGNQTRGDVWRALLRLQAEGVRVYAVPALVAATADAWVERVSRPDSIFERAPVQIAVHVFSLAAAAARVEVSAGEHPLASRKLSLVPGDNRIPFDVRFPRAGVETVKVRVSAQGDQIARNDVFTQDVLVQPRPYVLYVDGGKPSARYLADALTSQGIGVSVATAADLSRDAQLLADKDAVVLSDVRADTLTGDAAQRLEAFVREGGGLLFAAGQNTYGKDGYANSEVERLLPVKFESKRKREDLDLVLLIDRSSSMRHIKIEMAKSAALATLELLDEQHRLAVIAFDAQPHDVVPLLPVGDKRAAENLISRMTSSGQTNIYNALLRAQQLLADSSAKTKHIILLSDGLTAPPSGKSAGKRWSERILSGNTGQPAEESGLAGLFREIVGELADAQVSLSTVAIGEKPDMDVMTALAKWGNGNSYLAKSDAEVTTLFAAETHRLLGDAIVEEAFRPVVKGRSPALAGVDFAGGPALKGYVASRPKRFSEVLLQAKNDLPLLAETHYGLGKTMAFLSDAKNRWAADWLSWPGYARFWGQLVRDSARRPNAEGIDWSVAREGRNAVVQLTALGKNGLRNDLVPQVRITAPGGGRSVAMLDQVALGQYRAQVPLADVSDVPWKFELLPGRGIDSGYIARAGNRHVFYAYSDEYRTLPADVPLLRALSDETGGVFAPRAQDIFRARADGGASNTPLWRYCVGVALVCFLLDILVRRARWSWRRLRAARRSPR